MSDTFVIEYEGKPEYVRIRKQLLQDIMRAKDTWMIRALILQRRMGVYGDDVVEADYEGVRRIARRELMSDQRG